MQYSAYSNSASSVLCGESRVPKYPGTLKRQKHQHSNMQQRCKAISFYGRSIFSLIFYNSWLNGSIYMIQQLLKRQKAHPNEQKKNGGLAQLKMLSFHIYIGAFACFFTRLRSLYILAMNLAYFPDHTKPPNCTEEWNNHLSLSSASSNESSHVLGNNFFGLQWNRWITNIHVEESLCSTDKE